MDNDKKNALDHARGFKRNQAALMLELLEKKADNYGKLKNKFFTYQNNHYTSLSRPNNQSNVEVQQRIAERILRFVKENNLKMTTMQQTFIQQV